jgi:Tol biopolymer transport system component
VPAGRILFVRDGDVWLWHDGDAAVLFAHGAASDPRWSPDASQVLYVQNGDGYSDLVLRTLAGETDTPLTSNEPLAEPGSQEYAQMSAWVRDPAWSASGLVAFAADYNPENRLELWLLPVLGSPAVRAPDGGTPGHVEAVSLSAGGTLAAYTVHLTDGIVSWTEVALRDLTNGTPYVIADDPGGAYDPAISPNEASVVVSIRDGNGVSDLWSIERATGDRRQLTSGAQASAAVWSPDGAWIAYLRPDGDAFGLWAVPIRDGAAGEPVELGRWDGVDATSGLSWTQA